MEIKGVKLGLGYEGRMVLQDFDIEIRQGEITTFVGPNGSGKSTVLKTLTRLLPRKWGSCLNSIWHPRIFPYGSWSALAGSPIKTGTAEIHRKMMQWWNGPWKPPE